MGTSVGLNPATKVNYWIDRHRYYELKHFCLQYPLWKRASASNANGVSTSFYDNRIKMLEKLANETDSLLGKYVLEAATENLSYEAMRIRKHVPCCKSLFYEAYRRFFWLLSEARQ